MLDSEIADMKNVGGSYGGAITAAIFLSEFVGKTPWVHLDIAGPARAESDDGYLRRGGTGPDDGGEQQNSDQTCALLH